MDVSFTSITVVTKSIADPIIPDPGSAIKSMSLSPTFINSFVIISKYSRGVVFPGTPPKNPPPTSINVISIFFSVNFSCISLIKLTKGLKLFISKIWEPIWKWIPINLIFEYFSLFFKTLSIIS